MGTSRGDARSRARRSAEPRRVDRGSRRRGRRASFGARGDSIGPSGGAGGHRPRERLRDPDERDDRIAELERIRGDLEAQIVALSSAGGEPDSRAAETIARLETELAAVGSQAEERRREIDTIRGEIEGRADFQSALIEGNLPIPIMALDPELRVFVWNPAAESYWGVPAADVLQRRWAELEGRGS